MKAYKIAVPVADVIHGEPRTTTLQEINKLIKAHAEKLQYEICDDGYTYNINEPYIILYEDATVFTEHNVTVFNDCKFQEISWQDFLKLTPEDVNDGTPINLAQNTVENIQLSATHNFNKQALLDAFTAGWDAAHNNRFSIVVNFDKWYHEKAGEK